METSITRQQPLKSVDRKSSVTATGAIVPSQGTAYSVNGPAAGAPLRGLALHDAVSSTQSRAMQAAASPATNSAVSTGDAAITTSAQTTTAPETQQPGFFARAWQWTKDTTSRVVQGAEDLLIAAKDKVVAVVSDVTDSVVATAKSVGNFVKEKFNSVVEGTTNFVSAVVGEVVDDTVWAFNSAVEIGSSIASSIASGVSEAATSIASAFSSSSAEPTEKNVSGGANELALASESVGAFQPLGVASSTPAVAFAIAEEEGDETDFSETVHDGSVRAAIAEATEKYAQDIARDHEEKRKKQDQEDTEQAEATRRELLKVVRKVQEDPGLIDEDLPDVENPWHTYITQADLAELEAREKRDREKAA